MLRGIEFLIAKGIEHRRNIDFKGVYHHVSAGIIDGKEIDLDSISINNYDRHAEEAALNSEKHDSIIVIRIVGQKNENGKLGMSKPCKDCLKRIKNCKNIQYVYYSDHIGMIVREKAEEIQTDHVSGKNRKN